MGRQALRRKKKLPGGEDHTLLVSKDSTRLDERSTFLDSRRVQTMVMMPDQRRHLAVGFELKRAAVSKKKVRMFRALFGGFCRCLGVFHAKIQFTK